MDEDGRGGGGAGASGEDDVLDRVSSSAKEEEEIGLAFPPSPGSQDAVLTREQLVFVLLLFLFCFVF